MKKILTFLLVWAFSANVFAIDHPGITKPGCHSDGFVLIENGQPAPIIVSFSDNKAVMHAVKDLQNDFMMVSGVKPQLCESVVSDRAIIVGSLESELIQSLVSEGVLDVTTL